MAKQRAKSNGKRRKGSAKGPRLRRWKPGTMSNYLSEYGDLADRIDEIVQTKFMARVIELEAALDFYAWGPSPKGELEPMRGEEYAKAMAADGGKIARAYLKDRFDNCYYGVPKKRAPGGWGSGP